jgi:fatty-acyl-CoA synthase
VPAPPFTLNELLLDRAADRLYRSGDLGAIRVIGKRRYLYFFGRIDDWIRKDGENFSAQSVVELVESHPGVDRAAAYGVPHPVSDEWVMAALLMKQGVDFDPEELCAHLRSEALRNGDPRWLPDFVRIVDRFEWTETLKIKLGPLRADFYRPDRASPVFRRRRGGRSFQPFGPEEYARLEQEFAAAGRSHWLES